MERNDRLLYKETGMQREADLENECCQIAFEEYGYLNLKQLSDKGVPDRLFFSEGRCFFVEFKLPGASPTKYQQHIHDQLMNAGMEVYVIDNEEDFREACDNECGVHT